MGRPRIVGRAGQGADAERGRQLMITRVGAASMLAVGLLVYLPARHFVQDHWVMPLRMNNHVIVVQRNSAPKAIRPGDCVAYALHAEENGQAQRYLQDATKVQNTQGGGK